MLEYDRIDVFEGSDVNKTIGLYKCISCHYWYFLGVNVKFQSNVCNRFHDLMLNDISFNDVAIVYAKENDYRNYFW